MSTKRSHILSSLKLVTFARVSKSIRLNIEEKVDRYWKHVYEKQ